MAKNIVELYPIIVFSVCAGFISYYISGQLFETQRIISYIFTLTIGMTCAQGLGFLSGIIFLKSDLLAILFSIILYSNCSLFSNFHMRTNDFKPWLQILTNFSFMKFSFNSILSILYGFDRCPSDQSSIILYKFGVKDDILWNNIIILIIYALILRISGFFILYFKINGFLNQSKSKSIKYEDSDSLNNEIIETTALVDNNYNKNSINIQKDKDIQIESDLRENDNFKTLSIVWIDLTLKCRNRLFRKEDIILNKISGFIEFGSLNAFMGPSGAGKSSLLKSINGANRSQLSDQTMIYLSNCNKIKTCFITQDYREHLLNGLTAKQSLIYASKLKNSDKDVDHESIVKNLMIELLIGDISDTNVENCSGGEQKRIVIGMELTSHIMPNLICIDEPTSGLDSNAAEVVRDKVI